MKPTITSYSNGSYSYWSETRKQHINIPAELGKEVSDLIRQRNELLEALKLSKNYIEYQVNFGSGSGGEGRYLETIDNAIKNAST